MKSESVNGYSLFIISNVVPLMGFEPIASQGLNLSGLPVAYRGLSVILSRSFP